MDEKPDEKAGKCVVSLWLDPAIKDALDIKAKDIERSRSWMANLILKQAMGLIPDDDRKS
jgi:hypothetical protein